MNIHNLTAPFKHFTSGYFPFGSRHFSSDDLTKFLNKKSRLSKNETSKYKDHLNNCLQCWSLWNKVRWEQSRGTRGYLELKEYMNGNFKQFYDSSWAMAIEWNRRNPKSSTEIENFYKQNSDYLYNLVIWYESGDRKDFLNDFIQFRDRFDVRSVMDYGCGVGNDGLLLLEQGFLVDFVDYRCPSTDFLQWRLQKRNLSGWRFLDVEKLEKLPETDMFWAIDVLEHMVNPLWVVERLSTKTRVFVHRSEFGNDHGGRHPFHFHFSEVKLNDALRSRGFKHIPWPTLSVWVR